jgi:OOP family OmpA-OmpF porin
MSAHHFIRRLAAGHLVPCLALGIVLAHPAGPVLAADTASALEVRTGLHKDFTRLVVETSQPVPYKFSFPKDDEIVVTVTGAALHAAAKTPRPRGIIRDIEIEPSAKGSRLIIKTAAQVDIRRQFTLLPKDGHGARIVIDLAAHSVPAPAPLPAKQRTPAAPRVLLPAPHTDVIGARERAAPILASAAKAKPAKTAEKPARARPTEPFEVAAAGKLEMLFDRTPEHAADIPLELAQAGVTREELAHQELAHQELAQAGGLSINDWLMREGGNPNVRAIPPAPAPRETVNPPAPPAYPATPVYQAPAENIPARGSAAPAPAYGQPAYPARQAYPVYPAYGARQASPQHPSHPGYRTPAQQARPTPGWAPPAAASRQRLTSTQTGTPQGDAAARYASQTQAAPAIEQETAQREYRFYGGFGMGFSSFNYDSERNNTTLDEHLFTWKIFGGYRLSKLIALELAYGQVGGVDETVPSGNSSESQFQAVSASGLIYLPFNPTVVPFARAGIDLWWEDADDSAGIVGKEDTGAGIVLGLGADYRFSDRLSFRGEWEFHLLTDEVYSNNFLASVLYKF